MNCEINYPIMLIVFLTILTMRSLICSKKIKIHKRNHRIIELKQRDGISLYEIQQQNSIFIGVWHKIYYIVEKDTGEETYREKYYHEPYKSLEKAESVLKEYIDAYEDEKKNKNNKTIISRQVVSVTKRIEV